MNYFALNCLALLSGRVVSFLHPLCIFTLSPCLLKHRFPLLQIRSAVWLGLFCLFHMSDCSLACFVCCFCRPDLPWCLPFILPNHIIDFPVGKRLPFHWVISYLISKGPSFSEMPSSHFKCLLGRMIAHLATRSSMWWKKRMVSHHGNSEISEGQKMVN